MLTKSTSQIEIELHTHFFIQELQECVRTKTCTHRVVIALHESAYYHLIYNVCVCLCMYVCAVKFP